METWAYRCDISSASCRSLHVILSRRLSSQWKSSSCQLFLVFSESPCCSVLRYRQSRCVTLDVASPTCLFPRSTAVDRHLDGRRSLVPPVTICHWTWCRRRLGLDPRYANPFHRRPRTRAAFHLTGSGVIVSSRLRNAGNELDKMSDALLRMEGWKRACASCYNGE